MDVIKERFIMKDTELKVKIDEVIGVSKDAVVMATVDSEMRPRMRFMSIIFRKGNILYFGASVETRKVAHIKRNKKIQLLFHKQPKQNVVIEGECFILDDLAKKKELWENCPYDPKQHGWNTPEDPKFCVLKVNLTQAEYQALEPQLIEQTIDL